MEDHADVIAEQFSWQAFEDLELQGHLHPRISQGERRRRLRAPLGRSARVPTVGRRALTARDGDTRVWVRRIDGRFVLTWRVQTGQGWQRGGTRRLTLAELVAWQAAKRVPKP